MGLVTSGIIPGLASTFSPDQSLEMFRRMCLTRYFELSVRQAYDDGFIHCPIYLSAGQESISAAVATVISNYYIFAQHRAHSVYLAFGGNPAKLVDELLGRPTGCCGGMGGSLTIHEPDIKMIGCGLVGENVPLAAGVVLGAPGERAVCFFGDAAAEEDYTLSTLGFAVTHRLPVLFICEDNNLSILTPKSDRRSWETAEVARSFGMSSVDITDDPWLIAHHTRQLITNLPAFINCHTCRHLWHTGSGNDGPPEWDRLALVKEQLGSLGLSSPAEEIEAETKQYVENLWNERLPIPSKR
ncbi:thiamine pyrophosphate-dependent enzyme [Chloroflexota bacterium]